MIEVCEGCPIKEHCQYFNDLDELIRIDKDILTDQFEEWQYAIEEYEDLIKQLQLDFQNSCVASDQNFERLTQILF